MGEVDAQFTTLYIFTFCMFPSVFVLN